MAIYPRFTPHPAPSASIGIGLILPCSSILILCLSFIPTYPVAIVAKMPIFKSTQPDINRKHPPKQPPPNRTTPNAYPFVVPTDITIWDWLFDASLSPSSPLVKNKPSELAGYVDATTKERVNWQDVKEASTYISTALVKKYGFKEGQTLSLFSRNTIWYPVMMFAGIRVGQCFLPPCLPSSSAEC